MEAGFLKLQMLVSNSPRKTNCSGRLIKGILAILLRKDGRRMVWALLTNSCSGFFVSSIKVEV